MATVADFQITDYDGQNHRFYRFLDGYPCDRMGVFASFPLGNHDFCLETYVRRLALEQSDRNYWTDVSYRMDLSTRMVEVSSGCYEDFNFKGSFEEAIRRYSDENYSEKDAISLFPRTDDLENLLGRGLIDGFWDMIRAIKREIPELEYDYYEPRIIQIGDNPIFYVAKDFVKFPSCEMNQNIKAIEDAMLNARRLGLKTYFQNTITNDFFMLNYMITLERDGYILPLTREYIPYDQEIGREIKDEELEMIVEVIKRRNFKTARVQNFLAGIHSVSELEEIREAICNRKNNRI